MDEENKIKSWHWIVLFLIIISFFSLKLYSMHWPEARIKLAGQELKVLVAKDSFHLIKGLGGRENLGEYDGMIFIFNKYAKHAIVMRDMEFKIDIVWFKNGEVVDIAPDVPLESNVSEDNLKRYYPRVEANVVLELPAGWVEENGLKIGDKIEVN
ncbi:DUF192 domain-containing protein [Patescibacteria group bacterium]|nr:DUF192 domain-containing protein [Patescibacteria group bacterium]